MMLVLHAKDGKGHEFRNVDAQVLRCVAELEWSVPSVPTMTGTVRVEQAFTFWA